MTRVAAGVKGIVCKDLSLEFLPEQLACFPAIDKSSKAVFFPQEKGHR